MLDVRLDGAATVFTETGAAITGFPSGLCTERAPGVVACQTLVTQVRVALADANDSVTVDLPSSVSVDAGDGDDALDIVFGDRQRWVKDDDLPRARRAEAVGEFADQQPLAVLEENLQRFRGKHRTAGGAGELDALGEEAARARRLACCALRVNPDVGAGECGRIVYAVADHRHRSILPPQALDRGHLVFRQQLRAHLVREVGEDWWRSTGTGEILRGLFAEGTKPTSEQVAGRLGFDPLDTAPLVAELSA